MQWRMMIFNHLSLAQKVTSLAALGLLGGIVLSWPLWFAAARPTFPLLPIVGAASVASWWWSVVHAGLLLLLLVLVLIFPNQKKLRPALLLWLSILCCLDLNRLQPWIWFYALVIAVWLFGQNEREMRHTWRWLLAAVYAWSGFHKLTPYFAEENFAWFCEAFPFTRPLAPYPALGYAVALLETSLALGLLWRPTRRISRWLVVGFHAAIILMLSPLGLDWNTVVIPWNIALAGLVWLVFAEADATTFPKNNGLRLLLALAGVAPLFHFAGGWPDALSWKLYSNTQPEGTFHAPAQALTCTVQEKAMWEENAFDQGTKLLLDDWASREMRVPMVAADRTFRQTALYLCRCTTPADSAGLYILTVRPWNRQGERWQKIPCRVLLNKPD